MSGLTALAGSVQAVVVQTANRSGTSPTFSTASSCAFLSPLDISAASTANPTYTDLDLWPSSYLSSDSASAVRLEGE